MFFSPLRYPGGKSKLTAYVLETMKLNGLEGAAYVEPFAGGC
ncbi:DNA adenine methylase, partial [Aeromonas dhakensis]